MLTSVSPHSADWLPQVREALRASGCAVVEGLLDANFLARTREAVYRARDGVVAEVGRERLTRAEELGVIRLPMRFDDHFFRFLEIPEVLAVVDATVSPTAILHLQNAFALPDLGGRPLAAEAFQSRFHQDFPRVLNGYLTSLNAFFAIDAFTAENGATLVVPGTHQRLSPPDRAELAAQAIPVVCPAGSLLFFDSTLWHAGGVNRSGGDRLSVNHQFTRSFIKQQIDYVRALGDEVILAQPPRTQQLLGWYTRVVTSLDEYYRPETERLYRKGQG